ncbi:MAG TPA: PilZ domain-containing protein [Vicinamibacteria bacterium]
MREGVDERQQPRFPIRVPLYIAATGDVVRKTIELESRDISAGGVCFETGQEIPLDARSRIVISRLGDLPHPILIHGRVAWRQKHPFNGRFLVGVEFTEFENVTREEVLARIEAWRSGAGPA